MGGLEGVLEGTYASVVTPRGGQDNAYVTSSSFREKNVRGRIVTCIMEGGRGGMIHVRMKRVSPNDGLWFRCGYGGAAKGVRRASRRSCWEPLLGRHRHYHLGRHRHCHRQPGEDRGVSVLVK